MTHIRTISFTFIFVVALFSGFRTGASFDQPMHDVEASVRIPFKEDPQTQHNLLIISADQINSANAELKSIWIMAFYTDTPRIDFFPIFPQPGVDGTQVNLALANSFSLNPSGEPTEFFWNEMQKHNMWWNGYLLMDETTTNLFGNQLEIESQMAANSDWDDEIPLWFIDSQTAQEIQKTVYQSQCQNLPRNIKPVKMISNIFFHHDHFHTNLTYKQMVNSWRILNAKQDSISCEFPTFSQITP